MGQLVLVIHNVRSAHNVGSLLRTAEGFGVEQVYLTGYTPYPVSKTDERLPHQRRQIANQIHKTALGAEDSVRWLYQPDIASCLNLLKTGGYTIIALEQTASAIELNSLAVPEAVALIVGNEVSGIDQAVLDQTDAQIHIPMKGQKESFNVAVAGGIALYYLSFGSPRQK